MCVLIVLIVAKKLKEKVKVNFLCVLIVGLKARQLPISGQPKSVLLLLDSRKRSKPNDQKSKVEHVSFVASESIL